MTIRYAPNTYEGTLGLSMHTADNQITVYIETASQTDSKQLANAQTSLSAQN